MNEAQQIVKELLGNLELEMNSQNVMHLFDTDRDLEFETEAPVVYWTDRETNPEAYKAYQDEVQAMYDKVKGLVESLELEGDGEGEGEYCYGVIKIGEVCIKAEWSYYSYDGCRYDDIVSTLRVVTPKQKTITVYE